MTLLELAERCENSPGPDRELDAWIMGKTDDPAWSDMDCEYARSDPDRTCGAPRYTASFDAAMTLVPEDRAVELAMSPTAPCHAAVICGEPERWNRGFAATPALALCAAALRARAAITETEA